MENELATLGPKSLLETMGSIKWTNLHDCPTGYKWNEDGWVQTEVPYLQVTVNMLPYLLSKLGEEEILYQNMLALRYLNTKGVDELKKALTYKFRMSYFRQPDTVVLNNAVVKAYRIDCLSEVISVLNRDIFAFYDIWYSTECTVHGRKQIQSIIRQEYIERSRNLMPICSKYKTQEVMEFADVSRYAVDLHWKMTGLDKTTRTGRAIGEAFEELMQKHGMFDITQQMIADTAGVSVRTLQSHLTKKISNI